MLFNRHPPVVIFSLFVVSTEHIHSCGRVFKGYAIVGHNLLHINTFSQHNVQQEQCYISRVKYMIVIHSYNCSS